MLSKHNAELTDALRRIHLDRALSVEGMRAAIETVLAKVGLITSATNAIDSHRLRFRVHLIERSLLLPWANHHRKGERGLKV
jgi:hypothetical protein